MNLSFARTTIVSQQLRAATAISISRQAMDISFLVVALFRVSFMVPIEAEIASTDFAVLMANSMSYSKVIAGAVVVAS